MGWDYESRVYISSSRMVRILTSAQGEESIPFDPVAAPSFRPSALVEDGVTFNIIRIIPYRSSRTFSSGSAQLDPTFWHRLMSQWRQHITAPEVRHENGSQTDPTNSLKWNAWTRRFTHHASVPMPLAFKSSRPCLGEATCLVPTGSIAESLHVTNFLQIG